MLIQFEVLLASFKIKNHLGVRRRGKPPKGRPRRSLGGVLEPRATQRAPRGPIGLDVGSACLLACLRTHVRGVRVRACMRACVRVFVRVCAFVCVCVHVCVCSVSVLCFCARMAAAS